MRKRQVVANSGFWAAGHLALALVLLLPSAARAAEGASISGVVLDAISGAPLSGAQIFLDFSSAGVVTDNEGRFTCSDLAPKRYGFHTERKGYAKPQPFDNLIHLQQGQKVTGVVLRLWPEATISGRVVDKAGAVIESSVNVTKDGASFVGSHARTEGGRFRFTGLPAGTYQVHAQAWADSKGKYALTHFPNKATRAEGAVITVQPGEHRTNVDIVLLEAAPKVTLRVQYLGELPAGARASGDCAPMQEGFEPRGMRSNGMVDAKGYFELQVPAGKCQLVLQASFNGPMRPFILASKEITVLEPMPEVITLQPVPRYKVRAKIFLPNGKGELQTGGGFYVNPVERNFNLIMQPANRGDDGWLVAENLAPGRYEILPIELPEGLYVKSILSAGRSLLQTGLDLRSGAPEPITIQLASDGGMVSGVATEASGSPCAGCQMVLFSDSQHQQERSLWGSSAVCDTAGKFTAVGVAPGRYKVILRSGSSRRELETVQVPAGGKIQLSLRF